MHAYSRIRVHSDGTSAIGGRLGIGGLAGLLALRKRLLAAASILAWGLLLACGVGPASAALTRPLVSSFGSFANVQGLAVDQSTGDVYVLDTGVGEGSLLKFDASGKQLKFTGLPGESEAITGLRGGAFGENELAVDNSSGPAKGDVYVAVSTSNGAQIDVFASNGATLGTLSGATAPWGEVCGVATDSSGHAYVGVYSGFVDEFVPHANPVTDADYAGSIGGIPGICNIAVDSLGDVFADIFTSGPVTRYEASQLGSSSASGSVVDTAGTTLAIDPATNHLLVDERNRVVEYGPQGEPFQEPLLTFGERSIHESLGVAVNDANHEAYVSSGDGHVSAFGEPILLPTVLALAASGVSTDAAVLHGTVNPEGLSLTSCVFEYGTSTAYEETAPCPTAAGAGSSPVAETLALTALQPGTTYHFRLSATNENGVESSADRTFTTEAVFPPGTIGLPDGRDFELVSPANKHGSEAAAPIAGTPPYASAGADGNEVAYSNTGPIGDTPTGLDFFSISQRSSSGWSTRGALPRGLGNQELFSTDPEEGLGFSADMVRTVFGAQDDFVAEQQPGSPTPHLYRYAADGSIKWLGEPGIADPVKVEGSSSGDLGGLAGASSSYDTIYFAFQGTLTAADDEANPTIGNISRSQAIRAMGPTTPGGSSASDDGFFEWHEGVLESAGVLPDGHVDPDGAAPAATVDEPHVSPGELDGQVSEDGDVAFFVSPDPAAESARPTELYARKRNPDGTHTTALVSRDLQLPESVGLPSAAPSGVLRHGRSYIYATPDGSHVFFESHDRLTPDAPAEGGPLTYVFDVRTNSLTYLPGASVPISSTRDGSDFLFTREGELASWKDGSIVDIAATGGGSIDVARVSDTGSEFVFQTAMPFPGSGFNNIDESGEAKSEIYRYDVGQRAFDCLSCPPKGIVPSGGAAMSHAYPSGDIGNTRVFITGTRGISDDGRRVFFDTPDPLLAQDTNGARDVYEWEDGVLSLISTGISEQPSYFDDNSASGDDVFFSTAEGLVPSDADEGYDIYDARVPRPGDSPPSGVAPCEGAVCQGPPSTPQLSSAPASESFSGAGNVKPTASTTTAKKKSAPRKQTLAQALKRCRRERNKHNRERCVREVDKRYRVHASKPRHGAAHDRKGK